LQGRTLSRALAELCEQRNDDAAARVTFQLEGDDRPLPSALEAGLYRIAQEALNNAIRHGSAATITVALSLGDEDLALRVDDDGGGFEGARCAGGDEELAAGFGLVGMCERVRLLGGVFDVQSAPGAGTRVQVDIPLNGRSG